jgi:hypothetical protein
MPAILTAAQSSRALETAAARKLLPSGLSSKRQREVFSAAQRRASVFSARTANARYLQAIKNATERMIQGGRDYSPDATVESGRLGNDKAQLRLELKQILASLGYTPENGFPDGPKTWAAKPGSLRDLSSDARIDLILETQDALAKGRVQQAQGLEQTRQWPFPYWEFVRIRFAAVPREWPERWAQVGGPTPLNVNGKLRLIALKTDPVWAALGNSAEFDDALDVDHPPFAFRSGYGWAEVHRNEAQALGLAVPGFDEITVPQSSGVAAAEALVPTPVMSVRGVDDAGLALLKAKLAELQAKNPGTYGKLIEGGAP